MLSEAFIEKLKLQAISNTVKDQCEDENYSVLMDFSGCDFENISQGDDVCEVFNEAVEMGADMGRTELAREILAELGISWTV